MHLLRCDHKQLALIGPVQTTSSTGGFDCAPSRYDKGAADEKHASCDGLEKAGRKNPLLGPALKEKKINKYTCNFACVFTSLRV